VAAVAVTGVKGKIDTVRLTVCDLVLTGLHGPYVCHTPGGDDLDIGSKGLDAKLETDLVVAFSGSAVADGYGVLFAGDLHQLPRDSGTGHGGSQEILVLIYGAGLHAGHDKFIAELVYNIFNV